MTNPVQIRAATLLASFVASLLAAVLFVDFAEPGGLDGLDYLRMALTALTSFWLAWGGSAALLGLFVPSPAPVPLHAARRPQGLTAILVPVYNEDPPSTFSRIAAMNASLLALGLTDRFHFAVLSDTTSAEIADQEQLWFARLLEEPEARGRMFYRRRKMNIGKKAGNIEDFISRSGGAYDYAMILDADSLMEGATLAEMACRMDEQPDLGLLQSLPRIINARTLFGRGMQFSAAYLSPVFARGAALMQGREGPFWGHNAIVRVRAFAESCGLPVLSGRAPVGGHILSHDYVEAALLSRAGWTVRLDLDLEGSYEEGPENLIEYAKRDRRWCQGNLQHRKIIGAPGLKFWNRFTFLQGMMAYLASPLWLLLLAASIVSAAMPQKLFVDTSEIASGNQAAWGLAIAIASMLILPKFLILMRGMMTGENAGFGGTVRAGLSTIAEIAFSTLLAPVMLVLQSRAVFQVLFGLDGGWPATQRNHTYVPLAQAWAASWWIVITGSTMLAITLAVAPAITIWVLPAALPMMFSPVLITLGSRQPAPGRVPSTFLSPLELASTPVMIERERILAIWQAGPLLDAVSGPSNVAEAVRVSA